MNKKVVVFGATGNLGGCAVKAMLADSRFDDSVIVAATHKRAGLPVRIQIDSADFADLGSLIRILDGADTVIYAIPIHQDMATWNANVVAAVDQCKVEQLIRFSEPAADAGSSFLPLQIHGAMDERALARRNGGAIVVRPNFFMQNFSVYYQPMILNGEILLAHADGCISHVDLEDVGDVIAEIIINFDRYDKKVIDVTGEKAIHNFEISEIFSAALEKKCRYKNLDEALLKKGLIARGFNEFQIRFISELHELVRLNRFSYIASGIPDILGRQPKLFTQFVSENIGVWQ
jgi:uncharacterized protein YbjT (DUF2867 family)